MTCVSTRRSLLFASALLLGCVDAPDFPDSSLVVSPRVLAIVVEPPEAHPGQDVAVSLLLAGAQSAEVTWRACGGFDSFAGGGQYGDDEPDEGCGGGGLAFPLGEGETVLLPGALSARLFDNLEIAAMILGSTLPEDTVERIRRNVGLPFLIEATVRADGKLIRAVKRVLISERPEPHGNPPPPHFRVGDVEVIASGERPFECVAASTDAVRVATNTELELEPVVDGDEEPWLEDYQVLDLRGMLRDRRETAFYSWFATSGQIGEGTTKSPLRNSTWRTPRDPRCALLWLVMRDGRGGTSACGVQVEVGAGECE
jgi:hypothetical protein